MDLNELDFNDLTPVEIPIKNLLGKNYVLREASGDAVCKYRNALMKSAKMGSDLQIQSVDGIADVEPLLVSLCLFEMTTASNGSTCFKQVTTAEVRAWPNRIQKRLFDKIKEISDLDDKRVLDELKKRRGANAPSDEPTNGETNHFKEAVKNESGATRDGSD